MINLFNCSGHFHDQFICNNDDFQLHVWFCAFRFNFFFGNKKYENIAAGIWILWWTPLASNLVRGYRIYFTYSLSRIEQTWFYFSTSVSILAKSGFPVHFTVHFTFRNFLWIQYKPKVAFIRYKNTKNLKYAERFAIRLKINICCGRWIHSIPVPQDLHPSLRESLNSFRWHQGLHGWFGLFRTFSSSQEF